MLYLSASSATCSPHYLCSLLYLSSRSLVLSPHLGVHLMLSKPTTILSHSHMGHFKELLSGMSPNSWACHSLNPRELYASCSLYYADCSVYEPARTGPLRFQRPRTPNRLYGVQNATAFGAACPQQASSPLPEFNFSMTYDSISEDCSSIL